MEFVKDNWKLAAGLTAAAATGVIASLAVSELQAFRSSKENAEVVPVPQKWIRVGAVSELILYPVKSCKGINVHEAICTQIGLKVSNLLRDRIFMVVDERYVFQTQRTIPRMALIHVNVNDSRITLSSSGVDPITFSPPKDTPASRKSCRIFDDRVAEALDCGDEVAAWLSNFLEKEGLRLLYHSLDKTQRSLTPLQKKFPSFEPSHKGAFSDQTSYMVIAEESVKLLNTKLEKPVTHRNFRPSILITGIRDPFSEDYWGFVRIGDYGPVFKASKPCTRCKLTTVDPEKGEFDGKGEPLSTLTRMVRSYGDERVDKLVGNQAVIGVQLGLFDGEGAKIRVGDPVYAAVL